MWTSIGGGGSVRVSRGGLGIHMERFTYSMEDESLMHGMI